MGTRFTGLSVLAPGAAITTGASSASATIPTASGGIPPRFVRVAATVAAYVRLGTTAATAVAGDLLIQPGEAVVLAIPSGITKIAAIQVAAAGVVQVSPLENS